MNKLWKAIGAGIAICIAYWFVSGIVDGVQTMTDKQLHATFSIACAAVAAALYYSLYQHRKTLDRINVNFQKQVRRADAAEQKLFELEWRKGRESY